MDTPPFDSSAECKKRPQVIETPVRRISASTRCRNSLDAFHGWYVLGRFAFFLAFCLVFHQDIGSDVSVFLNIAFAAILLVNAFSTLTSIAYIFVKRTKNLRYFTLMILDGLMHVEFWYEITVGVM